ncbi:MAG: bifunctional glutamate N-acetyltransferase/amino-acid acetyltransferase ArgJ [Actinomycetota bacterium]|jgi:glutamate N-acetyltransferase/amino-acid N-acetyltransferase|nr:bifunctional glutamate N-acetyltransferase/amino-acid acetyltransferase ArgJ [Actinomycetota bacterium]
MYKEKDEKEYDKYFSMIENGTITNVPGFFANAVHSGVRRSRKDDLSMIYSPLDTVTSAVFTTNKFAAAPVIINKEQLSRSRNIKAIIINTGIANACTGEQGIINAEKIIENTAQSLRIKKENVAIASTGLIGKQLPIEKILDGIKELSKTISSSDGHRAARSILTIDKNSKELAVKINTKKFFNLKKDIIIGAIGKGSIMVAPNMGTILCFIATNVKIHHSLLDDLLREGVDHSFNSISIDGCQSTNDMVFIQSNGESVIEITKDSRELFDVFKHTLFFVLEEMAKKVILDGEGASKFVEIEVRSSRDKAEAKKIGMKIANSILVKASIFGETINWGRIASAIGSTDVEFNIDDVEIFINDFLIFKNGMEVSENMEPALPTMKEKHIRIKINMHTGRQSSFVWTTDLTHDFVKASSHYRS